MEVSCETIHDFIMRTQFYPKAIQNKYENLYLHALILPAFMYAAPHVLPVEEVLCKVNLHSGGEKDRIRAWIETEFNTVHRESMLNAPLFTYDSRKAVFISRKEQSQ